MGLGVWGLGFRGLGFRGLGFRVLGFGLVRLALTGYGVIAGSIGIAEHQLENETKTEFDRGFWSAIQGF